MHLRVNPVKARSMWQQEHLLTFGRNGRESIFTMMMSLASRACDGKGITLMPLKVSTTKETCLSLKETILALGRDGRSSVFTTTSLPSNPCVGRGTTWMPRIVKTANARSTSPKETLRTYGRNGAWETSSQLLQYSELATEWQAAGKPDHLGLVAILI